MILFDLDFTSLLALTLLIFSVFYYLSCQTKLVIKDSDVLFSSLILLNGGILLFQGWRLDPLLLFTEIVSTLLIIWFAIENINLRDRLSSFQVQINNKKKENKKINIEKSYKAPNLVFQNSSSGKKQKIKLPLTERESQRKEYQDF